MKINYLLTIKQKITRGVYIPKVETNSFWHFEAREVLLINREGPFSMHVAVYIYTEFPRYIYEFKSS